MATLRIPVADNESVSTRGTISTANTFSDLAVVQVEEVRVNCSTVDDLAEKYFSKGSDIRLIKIDVEGFELEVIKGATKTFADHKPFLYVEVEDRHGTPSRALRDFVEARGYKMFVYNGHAFVEAPPAGASTAAGDAASANVVFAHASRQHLLTS